MTTETDLKPTTEDEAIGPWQRFVAWYVAGLCTCDAYYGIQDACCNYHSSAALEQED